MTDHEEIARRLDEALQGRRARRDRVAGFCTALDEVARAFAGFVIDVESLGEAAIGVEGGDAIGAAVRTTFVDGPFGRAFTRTVIADLAEARRKADVIRRRVNRETVNLGVVGMARAGKSTLLRSITGLDDSVIPSGKNLPTTAALSRIVHSGDGSTGAVLRLHSWESFRDGYLRPLHESAGCGPAPLNLTEFASFPYPDTADLTDENVDKRRFLTKLREARDSLPSYRDLLGSASEKPVAIGVLRRFVAYPRPGDPQQDRPYHAVREVVIRTPFPELTSARIGLVDLPGAGEAGLDVARHFVSRLHNDVDLLMMVKFPDDNSSYMTDDDHKVVKLAEGARCGVPLSHFFVMVLNRKHSPEDPDAARRDRQQEDALADIGKALEHSGVRIHRANAQRPEDVRAHVLGPVLDHLARRLASMDQEAMASVVGEITDVTSRVDSYAAAVIEHLTTWRGRLGHQGDQLAKAARQLRIDLGQDLLALVADYDAKVADAAPDPAMLAAVESAVRRVESWMPGWLESSAGVGAGVDWLSTVERDYRTARHRISEEFREVRVSLEASTAEFYRDVAWVLRGRLTADLVGEPDDPTTLPRLEAVARSRDAAVIADALAELRQIEDGYGNVMLRVGRPIVRRVGFEGPDRPGDAADDGEESLDDRAARMFGLSGSTSSDTAGTERRAPRIVPRDAAALRTQLNADVERCLRDLERSLTAEARGLLSVLAHAADLFVDRVVRTNDIDLEYVRVCELHQAGIWPTLFGGGTARMSESMLQLRESALAVRSLAGSLTGAAL